MREGSTRGSQGWPELCDREVRLSCIPSLTNLLRTDNTNRSAATRKPYLDVCAANGITARKVQVCSNTFHALNSMVQMFQFHWLN